MPVPQRKTRVTAFDGTIQIVPMVEHTVFDSGSAGNLQITDGLVRLQVTQKVKHAVKHADVGVRGDDDAISVFNGRANDEVALITQLAKRFVKIRYRNTRQTLGCSNYQRLALCDLLRERNERSKQARQRPC